MKTSPYAQRANRTSQLRLLYLFIGTAALILIWKIGYHVLPRQFAGMLIWVLTTWHWLAIIAGLSTAAALHLTLEPKKIVSGYRTQNAESSSFNILGLVPALPVLLVQAFTKLFALKKSRSEGSIYRGVLSR